MDMSLTVKHLQDLQIKLRGPSISEIDEDNLDSRYTDILMMVLASALTLGGLGQSSLADQLVDEVEASRSRRSRAMQVNVKEVLIMAMMVDRRFNCLITYLDTDIYRAFTISIVMRISWCGEV